MVARICVRAVEREALPSFTSLAVAPHMPAAAVALDLVTASSFASFVIELSAEQQPSMEGAGPVLTASVVAGGGGVAATSPPALPAAATESPAGAGVGSWVAFTGAMAVAEGMAKTGASSSFLPQPTIAAAMRTMETSESERRAEVDMIPVYLFCTRAARDRREVLC